MYMTSDNILIWVIAMAIQNYVLGGKLQLLLMQRWYMIYVCSIMIIHAAGITHGAIRNKWNTEKIILISHS